MWRCRLVYLLLIGFGVFFYIAFIGYFSYYFLLVILVLPIVSFIYLLLTWKFLKLEFVVDDKKVRQNELVSIFVKRDKFGLGAIKFKIDNKKYLLRGNQDKFDISFKHCGGENLIIKDYYQYDSLNLFCLKKRCYYQIPITIYPKKIDFDFSVYQHLLPKDGEEVYAINQKGDDPTEIYDIHKYREGDLLKNIHWKLSAKYDDVLVKDNALSVSEIINIHCDFDEDDDHNDLVFSYLEVFCIKLLENKYKFLLSNKEITSIKEYEDQFKYLLWNKDYYPDVTKHNYEFIISYYGIKRIEGGHR
ncbi:DUF58 domain-containing protein [Thomasclavelia cocleata]|uniref:Uncharacterized protein n=1 Tax=Thomasclavelia cocleata TaxID=69824 RepID=A0A1I0FUQ9_9FIRM|nr:DUF58 domain-containing protein [Thomasclavelia cocleata]NDO43034.1 DUF58 domain-containing protein [Thomasclavelia cocleata]PJN79498.1 DUF58 domain-containing protein [Thomasclavelia cocleata]SET62144.1 Protein of unknown function DUF58 [Thomasclavelia cocleata]